MCSHLPNHLIILSSTDRQGKNILIKLLLGDFKVFKDHHLQLQNT